MDQTALESGLDAFFGTRLLFLVGRSAVDTWVDVFFIEENFFSCLRKVTLAAVAEKSTKKIARKIGDHGIVYLCAAWVCWDGLCGVLMPPAYLRPFFFFVFLSEPRGCDVGVCSLLPRPSIRGLQR